VKLRAEEKKQKKGKTKEGKLRAELASCRIVSTIATTFFGATINMSRLLFSEPC